MKLTSISGTNIKGATFSHPLTPITFLVGANYDGKSTRSDALKLALVGYLPELGKLPRANFDLASGNPMQIQAGTIEGETEGMLVRSWSAAGDKISTVTNVAATGTDAELTIVMLNADEWFGLTERNRVEWLARNVGAENKWTRAQILAELQKTVRANDQDFDHDPINALFAKIEKALAGHEKEEGAVDDRDLLDILIDITDTIQKESRDHAKTMEKTAAGLAGLRAQDAASVPLSEVETKLSALDKVIEEIRTRKAKAAADLDNQAKNGRRAATLRGELTGRTLAVAKRDSLAKTVDELRAQIGQLPSAETGINDLRVEERDLRNSLGAHRGELTALDSSICASESELVMIESAVCCPTCKAAGTGWNKAKADEIISCISAAKEKRKTLQSKTDNIDKGLSSVTNRIDSYDRMERERSRLVNEVTPKIGELRLAEVTVSGFAGKEGELSAIPENNPEIQTAADLTKTELKVKQDERDGLEGSRKQALVRQGDIKRLAEAEKGRDTSRIEEKIAKVATEGGRNLRSKIVEEAVAPVIERANAIFGHLMESPIAYNGQNASVGTWRGGRWIGHKTFSGLEKLIAYAAIQAALASKSKLRVMILDEMLRAQDTKKRAAFTQLVGACKAAVRNGHLDNFFGILPGDADKYAFLATPEEPDVSIIAIE